MVRLTKRRRENWPATDTIPTLFKDFVKPLLDDAFIYDFISD